MSLNVSKLLSCLSDIENIKKWEYFYIFVELNVDFKTAKVLNAWIHGVSFQSTSINIVSKLRSAKQVQIEEYFFGSVLWRSRMSKYILSKKVEKS